MKSALLAAAKQTGILISPAASASLQLRNEVQEIWSFECEDELRSTPIVHNGIMYIGCYDNNLYALDAKKGSFLLEVRDRRRHPHAACGAG